MLHGRGYERLSFSRNSIRSSVSIEFFNLDRRQWSSLACCGWSNLARRGRTSLARRLRSSRRASLAGCGRA
eukprot:29229-Pleurochrysis_carterae.AAC.1